MTSRLLLIINPSSGQGRIRQARGLIAARLRNLGELEIVDTTGPGDAGAAAKRAVESGVDRVIVAGGDGTINEVINVIAGARVALGLIPNGTGNVLARELAIPLDDPGAACGVIESGRLISIDLGKFDTRYFVSMAGFGFDAEVVERVEPRVKNLVGQAAYGIAAVGALLRHKPSHFVLNLDGQLYETDASLVVVANVSSYALRLRLAPDAAYDDGRLDVIIFESTGLTQKITLLTEALRLILQRGPETVRCFRAGKIRVESQPPVLAQLDGDIAGQTPTYIEVAPSALRIIVPA